MKREIKFRAWDKRNQRWSDDELYIDADGNLFEIREASRAYQSYMHKVNVNDNYNVNWYTGLKDKNGNEIYEGDIVAVACECDPGDYAVCTHPPVITYVDWFQENASFELRDATGEWSNEEFSDDYQEVYKVIGNIYENADLLKGDAK